MGLNFAIEATNLANRFPTGISRYTRHLIEELAGLRGGAAADDFELTLLYRASRFRRRGQVPSGPGMRRQLWFRNAWPPLKRFDLVHCPDHRLPQWPGVPKIVSVHDVFSAVGINFDDPQARERQNAVYRDFAARAQWILFVSAHTRADFLAHFPYDAARSSVIHLGVGAEFRPRNEAELAGLRARHGLTRPYLLFLGLLNPNKNLARLMEAFAGSALRESHDLLLAGQMPDDQRTPLTRRVAELGLDGRVRFAGYVSNGDVPLLYAGAAALMFPSTYEGFGLPILEAMACGTPVLTGNVSSCPEVAAGHAVLVDPYSVAAIGAGIEQAVAMDATRRDAARAYAATRTWRRTAELTLAAYRAALAAA